MPKTVRFRLFVVALTFCLFLLTLNCKLSLYHAHGGNDRDRTTVSASSQKIELRVAFTLFHIACIVGSIDAGDFTRPLLGLVLSSPALHPRNFTNIYRLLRSPPLL